MLEICYLILTLTTRCNLRCRYCYHGTVASPAVMSAEVVRRAIDLAAASGRPFHLQLTGGEPTLEPILIEMAASLARRTGHCGTVGIQTNGTRLTQGMLDILKQCAIQVGVSLDGSPQVHQAARGQAAETLKGLQQLESAGIPFRVTTVVTQANAAKLEELVLILAGYSMARGIGLDLLVRKGRANGSNVVAPADPAALDVGLQRLHATLDAVNARRSVPIQWREWEMLFPADGKPKRRSEFCHAGLGQSLAVTPDGQLFPCSQTLNDPHFYAGTVWQPHREALLHLKTCRAQPEICNTCDVNAICPGDCPSRCHYNQNHHLSLACSLYRMLHRLGHGNRQDTIEGGPTQ